MRKERLPDRICLGCSVDSSMCEPGRSGRTNSRDSTRLSWLRSSEVLGIQVNSKEFLSRCTVNQLETRDLYKFPRKAHWLRRLENYGRKERVHQAAELNYAHLALPRCGPRQHTQLRTRGESDDGQAKQRFSAQEICRPFCALMSPDIGRLSEYEHLETQKELASVQKPHSRRMKNGLSGISSEQYRASINCLTPTAIESWVSSVKRTKISRP